MQSAGDVGEKLPVKLQNMRGAGPVLRECFFRRGQGAVQHDDDRVLVQEHGHPFAPVIRSTLLESASCPRELLTNIHLIWVHCFTPRERRQSKK